MKRALVFAAVSILCCNAIALAAAPPLPKLLDAEWAQLRAGEPVLRDDVYTDPNGNSCGKGYALIKINGTPEQVWQTILDYDHYGDFFPNVDYCKLYRRDGDVYYAKFTLSVIVGIKVTYHCKHTLHRADGWLEWTLDSSQTNEFKATDGRWVVWPFEGGALVSYSVFVDTGRDVPEFIQNMASKWGLKQVVLSVKQRVESGGTYTR